MIISSEKSKLLRLRQYLPSSVSQALSRLSSSLYEKISEIRLRADGITGITLGGENLFLSNSGLSCVGNGGIILSKADLEDFLYKFCKGSIYTHENSLSEFFVTNDGIRVGIGGKALRSKDGIIVGDISSLNIRIPNHVAGCSKQLMDYIYENGFCDGKGILIISKPGVGKTTMLRDLAINLSSSLQNDKGFLSKRVCVIDERNEIFMEKIFSHCSIDFLSGMSKVKGMEIAMRVLSPEIIICDEIASPEEAEKITQIKNHGITFIASFHCDNYENAIKKDFIRNMFEKDVFGLVYSLENSKGNFSGEITEYRRDA